MHALHLSYIARAYRSLLLHCWSVTATYACTVADLDEALKLWRRASGALCLQLCLSRINSWSIESDTLLVQQMTAVRMPSSGRQSVFARPASPCMQIYLCPSATNPEVTRISFPTCGISCQSCTPELPCAGAMPGLKFLVDLRADVLKVIQQSPAGAAPLRAFSHSLRCAPSSGCADQSSLVTGLNTLCSPCTASMVVSGAGGCSQSGSASAF